MPSHTPISRTRSPWRAALAALVVTGLVAAGASSPAFAATDDVTGFAFRDFNSNGFYDTGHAAGTGSPNDVPLAGVLVHAYDASGADVGNATTDSSGTYSINSSSPAGTQLRVEFSFSSGQLAEGYKPSYHGAANGTSVQFVTVGAAGVNFAANVPEDYIQANPDVAIAAQRYGDTELVTGLSKDLSSVIKVAYEQSGDSPSTLEAQADYRDTGSIYGLAYQKGTTNLFASAVLRAHTGLGEGGLGGIYLVDTVANTSSLWLDVSTTVDVGESTFAAQLSDTAGATENERRGLVADPNLPNRDPVAVENVGIMGLGGLTISTDQKTLYAVNLFNRSLVVIDIATKTTSEVSLGTLSEDDRPFGVAVHRGVVYVGIVDSATSTGLRADLGARVITTPESALASPSWSTALDIDSLSFGRGGSSNPPAAALTGDVASHWNAWTNDWSDAEAAVFFGSTWITNPQPILSTMTFDVQGNLVMGFLDRFSYQAGMLQYEPTGNSTVLYSGIAAGGMYGASPDGDGTYTFENNGVLGGVTGGDPGNNRGPGGGRYYDAISGVHSNALTGAVAAAPGFSTILSTGYDLNGAWTSEAGWIPTSGEHFSLSQRVLRNSLTDNQADPNDDTTAGFGKAGGLGGVTLLAELAPVEIGNRVWFDADQDGIQDADEPPMSGVPVELYDATGTILRGTTTTNAAGEYYFSGLNPDTTYTVVFVKPVTGSWNSGSSVFGTIPWSDISLTEPTSGTNTAIDSNPDNTGKAIVELGGPGENDHTIDAGFIANAEFTVQKLIGSGTPADGQTFTINFTGKDFRGAPYTVNPASVAIEANETSDVIVVPAGTSVKLAETSDPSISGVTYGGATPDSDGFFLVAGATAPLALTVTNELFEPGRFSVEKLVSGDFDLADVENASFTINYTYPGGGSGSLVLNKANSFKATSPNIPYGTVVTLSEAVPTGGPANVGWGTPTWGDSSDSTVTITIGDNETTELQVTNPTMELFGTFNLTKSVTGDTENRVGDDVEFTVEYSLDGGTTWVALPAVKDGATVSGPASIPTGTTVLIRELAPPVIDDVEWGTAAFSGSGVTPGSPASFVIGNATTVAVLLENPTTPRNGQFSVTKDVTGPGENLLAAGTTFTVNYTYEGGSGSFTLGNGQSASSPLLPTGTVVTITEVVPTTGLPKGAAWGTPTLSIDGVTAANGATLTIGDQSVVSVVLANPTDVTPTVEITKGDGSGTTIAHEADTVATGEAYANGETRTIVIVVENTGPEPLRNVKLTDQSTSGGSIAALTWTFPDSSTTAAVWNATTKTWSATWPATFSPGTTQWAVGDKIYGSATLTVNARDDSHQDFATVDAVGAYSGKDVTDDNPYNAFTGSIQIIKYDGEKGDPVVKTGDEWVTPTKPLLDTAQDANTPGAAVTYPISKDQKVRWVVTNTGPTSLTNISLVDVTSDAPAIGDNWTADLSPFGGPADYSFVKDGPWMGLLPPGASFFAQGTLKLPALDTHADTVTVVGTVVVPKEDPTTGLPTEEPLLDVDGKPVIAIKGGVPFTVTDNDPFHAKTPAAPVPAPLASTGATYQVAGLIGVSLLLLLSGAAVVLDQIRRRRISRV